MRNDDAIALLCGWEGYAVGTVQRYEASDAWPVAQVWIELRRQPGPLVCSGCGRACAKAHDWTERWVRDLPILDAETHRCVPRFRAACPVCGPKVEPLPWLAKHARVTTRFAEANQQTHRGERQVLKGSRELLLRNADGLKRSDRVKLRELRRANRRLATTYILRDDLKRLWTYRYPDAAERFWKEGYLRAIRSGIAPLKRFARRLRERIDGIIAHCRYPLHTRLLEGINNRIKVIKRVAYGFRDDACFFLTIRQAFPGNTG